MLGRPPRPSPLFPYTTLFRSGLRAVAGLAARGQPERQAGLLRDDHDAERVAVAAIVLDAGQLGQRVLGAGQDRKSTRLNSSHPSSSYAVFCLKKINESRALRH